MLLSVLIWEVTDISEMSVAGIMVEEYVIEPFFAVRQKAGF